MRGSVAKMLRRATSELNEISKMAHGKRVSFRKVKRMYKNLPWTEKGELLPQLYRAQLALQVKVDRVMEETGLTAMIKRKIRAVQKKPLVDLPKGAT
jgi:hypothetical protein